MRTEMADAINKECYVGYNLGRFKIPSVEFRDHNDDSDEDHQARHEVEYWIQLGNQWSLVDVGGKNNPEKDTNESNYAE